MSEEPAATRRLGRPPSLTRDAIGRAVVEVGFPHLTFAAVRERLGVGESTLFRYAPDRDRLVQIGLEYAISQVEWPSLEGPWRVVVERYAFAAWYAWERYPGAATEATRGIVPDSMVALMNQLCAVLMRQGFSVKNAVLACDIVFDMVTDHRRGVEQMDLIAPDPGPGRDRLRDMWQDGAPATLRAPELEEGPEIRAEIRASISAEPLDWFAAKLGVVLSGVENQLAP